MLLLVRWLLSSLSDISSHVYLQVMSGDQMKNTVTSSKIKESLGLNNVRNIYDGVSTRFNKTNNKGLIVFWHFNAEILIFTFWCFPAGDLKDVAIGELQEQLRDVMFYLETQQQIEHLPPEARSEIQEGQINIGASPSDGALGSAGAGPSSGRGRRGRGRKRK